MTICRFPTPLAGRSRHAGARGVAVRAAGVARRVERAFRPRAERHRRSPVAATTVGWRAGPRRKADRAIQSRSRTGRGGIISAADAERLLGQPLATRATRLPRRGEPDESADADCRDARRRGTVSTHTLFCLKEPLPQPRGSTCSARLLQQPRRQLPRASSGHHPRHHGTSSNGFPFRGRTRWVRTPTSSSIAAARSARGARRGEYVRRLNALVAQMLSAERGGVRARPARRFRSSTGSSATAMLAEFSSSRESGVGTGAGVSSSSPSAPQSRGSDDASGCGLQSPVKHERRHDAGAQFEQDDGCENEERPVATDRRIRPPTPRPARPASP